MNKLTCLVFVVAAVVGWAMPATIQAQPSESLHVLASDSGRFPEIELTVAYRTGQNLAPTPPPPFSISVGTTTITPTVQLQQGPLSVAIVTDLSDRISDRDVSGQPRFAAMQSLARRLVNVLGADRDPASDADRTSVSLVTFGPEPTVAYSRLIDLGKINNGLGNSDSAVRFVPQQIDPAVPAAPYALGAAIEAGLAELAQAPEDEARVLVVFAAGDAGQQVDLPKLTASLEKARQGGPPTLLLVVGLGSDQAGSYGTYPANLTGLRQLAEGLGGTFFTYGDKLPSPEVSKEIDELFARVLGHGQHYLLRFGGNTLPVGVTPVQVSVGSVSTTVNVTVGQVPPRFNVVVSSRAFQGEVLLSIETISQQADLAKVEYLLDGRKVGGVMTNGPNFEWKLDTYNEEFQRLFPPGQYTLTAAATDANGQESRSELPIEVQVFQPPAPPDGIGALVSRYWWIAVAALIAAGAGVGAYMVVQRRMSGGRSHMPPVVRSRRADELTSAYAPDEDVTNRYGDDDPDATARYDSDDGSDTLPYIAAVNKPQPRWVIEVVEGDDFARIELQPSERYYDIGRVKNDYSPPIVLKNRNVSRGTHATLELFVDGLDLIAGASENGTFFGDHKEPLKAAERRSLQSGDIFWVSPAVKLRVEKETHPA